MTRLPVPFTQRQQRLPVIGRIRMGVKSGKAMKAIDTFRFTSGDHEAIAQIAELYGGTPRPWSDAKAAKGQLEVITEAREIRVILPPDPLGDTPIYEKFGGKGIERRCDGVTCERTQDGPEGPEALAEPCICMRNRRLECRGQLRLAVILDGVRVTGTWRLDSKSEQACEEMPAWVEQIQRLQGSALSYAVLRIEHRQTRGGRNKFVVPVLGIPVTPQALASGAARLTALPSPSVGELPAAPAESQASPTDDDVIVDAEIVDELQDALNALNEDERDEVKEWWAKEGLPKKADLSEDQRAHVLAHLR